MRSLSTAVLFMVVFSLNATGQVLLRDDFGGATLNTNSWSESRPFPQSQVSLSSGKLILVGRGGVASKAAFTNGFQIEGRFRFNSLDHLSIGFRSDLSVVGPFAEKQGVFVSFSQDGGQLSIQKADASHIDILAVTNLSIPANTDIPFRITDDGVNVRVFVYDFTVPKIQTQTTFRTGDQIVIQNRDFASTRTEIDFVEIRGLVPSLNVYTAAVELEFFTEANKLYQLQSSTDFQNWTNLGSAFQGTGSLLSFTNWIRGASRLFYRVETLTQP